MNREKKLIIVLCAYVIVLLILATLRCLYQDEQFIFSILNYLIVVLTLLFAAIILSFIIATMICLKQDSAILHKAFDTQDYLSAIRIFEKKIQRYFLGRLIKNAKYSLLCLYFMSGQNEKGKQLLLSTHWGIYSKSVLYFHILILLIEEDVEQAIVVFNRLKKSGRKVYTQQIEICDRIFSSIYNDDFSDIFYVGSYYPIVKNIYELYKNNVT